MPVRHGGTQSPIRFLSSTSFVAVSLLASTDWLKIALWHPRCVFGCCTTRPRASCSRSTDDGVAIEFDRSLSSTHIALAVRDRDVRVLRAQQRELRLRRADAIQVEVGGRLDDASDPLERQDRLRGLATDSSSSAGSSSATRTARCSLSPPRTRKCRRLPQSRLIVLRAWDATMSSGQGPQRDLDPFLNAAMPAPATSSRALIADGGPVARSARVLRGRRLPGVERRVASMAPGSPRWRNKPRTLCCSDT